MAGIHIPHLLTTRLLRIEPDGPNPPAISCSGGAGVISANLRILANQGRSRPISRDQFSVAIFCALPCEAGAVTALFDQIWNRKQYGKAHGDINSYTLGAMGDYDVVLVHLAGIGKCTAASSASSCRMSFTGIRLALVVGVCGGVPFGPGGRERILGDTVISNGLVQYDFGSQYPNEFERKRDVESSLSRPNVEIRGFLARLESDQNRQDLQGAIRRHTRLIKESGYAYLEPDRSTDILYNPSYVHKHRNAAECPAWTKTCGTATSACHMARTATCETLGCDDSQIVTRQRLQHAEIDGCEALEVHIGQMASGDKVMKSGEERDRVAADENVIAFEMEGAGVWEELPCLVVEGIGNYADCHKNNTWQGYAAVMAAACARALLEQWD